MKRFCALTMLVFPLLVALHSTAVGAVEGAKTHIEDTSDIVPTSLEEELFFEEEDLVTGTSKRAIKLSEAPANVTIITHDDIMQSGATNLGEVFRRVAGMDVVTISPAETDVSARGFVASVLDGNRMQVLVDGKQFNLDFVSSTIWALFPFPLADIKRIEVVKGPMSALYGNHAMLGIINIITFEPEETRTLLSGGGGRFKMATGSFINAGKFAEGYWYKVTGSYDRSDRYENLGLGLDDKQRETVTATARLVAQPQDATRISLDGSFGHGSGVYDLGGLGKLTDNHGHVQVKAEHDFDHFGILSFQGSWERNSIKMTALPTTSATNFDTSDLEIRHSFGIDISDNIQNHLTYGFNYRLNDSNRSFISSIHNFAGFLQNEMRFFDKIILTGGVRVDYQKDFAGLNTSVNGSLVWLAHPIYTARVGIGTAFSNPNMVHYFTEIFQGASPHLTFVGNRNLKAEHILYTWFDNEISPLDWLTFNVNFFYYRMNEMLAPAATPLAPAMLQINYVNDGGAEAIGGEIGVELEPWKDMTFFANWSYEQFDAINGNLFTNDNLGNPKNKTGAGFRGKWFERRLTLNLEFYYVQDRQATAASFKLPTSSVVRVDDIYLLNARVAFWPIADHLELAVSTWNLLDDNSTQAPAQSAHGTPLAEKPKFNVWGSLKYIF